MTIISLFLTAGALLTLVCREGDLPRQTAFVHEGNTYSGIFEEVEPDGFAAFREEFSTKVFLIC